MMIRSLLGRLHPEWQKYQPTNDEKHLGVIIIIGIVVLSVAIVVFWFLRDRAEK